MTFLLSVNKYSHLSPAGKNQAFVPAMITYGPVSHFLKPNIDNGLAIVETSITDTEIHTNFFKACAEIFYIRQPRLLSLYSAYKSSRDWQVLNIISCYVSAPLIAPSKTAP